MQRTNVGSGAPWESKVGYSRAVRVGNLIFVSGTVAPASPVRPGNAYGQAVAALRVIEAALRQVGAALSDVVRTRMFVTDIADWQQIGKAHAQFFGGVAPAATMVEVRRLFEPDVLVEIEVDAVIA